MSSDLNTCRTPPRREVWGSICPLTYNVNHCLLWPKQFSLISKDANMKILSAKHVCNCSTWEAKADGLQWFWGQPELYTWPCLKIKSKQVTLRWLAYTISLLVSSLLFLSKGSNNESWDRIGCVKRQGWPGTYLVDTESHHSELRFISPTPCWS